MGWPKPSSQDPNVPRCPICDMRLTRREENGHECPSPSTKAPRWVPRDKREKDDG